MSEMPTVPAALLRSGEWLVQPSDPAGVFTPERLTEEHRLVGRTVAEFVAKEVLPVLHDLERKDWPLARRLVQRAGALGFLGIDVEDAYGGVGLDKITSIIVSERMAVAASFGATFGAQTNLTILPLALFGTDGQKQQYLPKLLTGETIGAYCLTEPGSGSDALGARARADRTTDGFVLNGEKMWITNGGFADVFIVFAKIDGEHFSAFIVERAFPGVSSGHEEHKMGLHGSSTTAVILQDVRVPAANLLGEAGKGHKIAFNILNFARLKLGAGCVGSACEAIGHAARYAAQRKQFGQPIAAFGAIKHKIGEMVVRTYAIESLLYRTAGLVQARIDSEADPDNIHVVELAAFEEYAVEASIAKVAASEMLNFVLDENIQIHGGNGYVRDYQAERLYRDSRVNRIFEGTNEINRLLIPGVLAKRAAKGTSPIREAVSLMHSEAGSESAGAGDKRPLANERKRVAALKTASLLVFGTALQAYREQLAEQQEVLMNLADILIDVYASESAVLRACAAAETGGATAQLHQAAARVFLNDAEARIEMSGCAAFGGMLEGDALEQTSALFRRTVSTTPINTVTLRRQIADRTVAKGGYPF
jgi:alkylation response protein AidB-like acyl-CoA dehydrogenase